MKKYPWAANKLKLQRAIDFLGGDDEKELKKYYKKIGGLILKEDEDTNKNSDLDAKPEEPETRGTDGVDNINPGKA